MATLLCNSVNYFGMSELMAMKKLNADALIDRLNQEIESCRIKCKEFSENENYHKCAHLKSVSFGLNKALQLIELGDFYIGED